MIRLCTSRTNSVLKTLDSVTIFLQEAERKILAKTVMITTTILTILLPRLDIPIIFLNKVRRLPSKGTFLVTHSKTSLHESPTAFPSTACQITIQIAFVE